MDTKSINVNYGEITIVNYKQCEIESNGVRFNYTIGDIIPGLWFGLIN